MAEDIVFKAEVDKGGEGAKSLSSLKKEFSELQKQLDKTTVGTKEYQKTLQKLGQVKDDIGDLRDSINALNPEGKVAAFQNVAGKLAAGFQAATGAAALFGVESEELEKTLLKVQAATAFAEGIKGIAGMKDAFIVLGNVIKANPIFILVSVLAAVAAAVVYFTNKTKDLKIEIEEENEVIASNIKVLERQIELLEAQGGQDQKIINLKKEKVALQIQEINNSIKLQKEQLNEINNNATLFESIQAALGYGAAAADSRYERGKELRDKIIKGEQDVADLKTHLAAEEIKTQNKLAEEAKKIAEEEERLRQERIKNFQQMLSDNLKSQEEYDEFIAEEHRKAHEQELKDFEDHLARMREAEEKEREQFDKEQNQRIADDLKAFEERKKQEVALEKQKQAETFALAQQAAQAQQALSDFYFAVKLANVKKGSAEEERVARNQFKINKALQIQTAVISGIQGVLNALTAQWAIPEPFATVGRIASAVAVGLGSAAQIAKISAVQFNNSGYASGADTSVPTLTSSVPNIPTQAPTTAPTTRLDDQGRNLNKITVKAEVVETESTATQNRVKRLENQATF